MTIKLSLLIFFISTAQAFARDHKPMDNSVGLIAEADISCYDKNNFSSFTPQRKASRGSWRSEVSNPSHHIILSAGHVNRVSGTTGYNNQQLVSYKGYRHTTEAILTKIVTPFMVEIGRQRGFSVEQFVAQSDNFRQASLELANYERMMNGIAFEIHSDSPSEGHHRSPNYDGQTGIIPAADGTITPAEACAGKHLGKFKKGMRGLYVPKQGVSLFELFPTNKAITYAVHHAIKTGDDSEVKRLALPYVNLFFDALEQGGIKPVDSSDFMAYKSRHI